MSGLNQHIDLSAYPQKQQNETISGAWAFQEPITSSVTTGNTPFVISSTTAVANLNSDLLDGFHVGSSGNSIPILSNKNNWSDDQEFEKGIISNVTTGTPPFIIKSSTLVSNLNADMVDGANIGVSGPSVPLLNGNNSWSGSQAFTTQFSSSVTTGTAPFTVNSTTKVTNLNADLLDGKDTGTSGNVIPLLDGNNTHSGTNFFAATCTFDHASADTVAAIFGVDDGGSGFAKAFQGKINGVTKLEWGNSFGLAGFVNPANDFFFFGMSNGLNYLLQNAAANNTTLSCGGSSYIFDSTQLDLGTKTLLSTGALVGGTGNLQAGLAASLRAKVGGDIFESYTDVGNSGTSETDIFTNTIEAGALIFNGQKIDVSYSGIFVGAATSTQRIRCYFGGTLIYDSGALSILSGTYSWNVKIEIIRESATVIRAIAVASSDFTTVFPYCQYTRVTGLSLVSNQIIKITGTAAGAGASSNQIVGKMASGEWRSST